MVSTIQKISSRAKAIRRAHPSKAWKDCIKQASREYNSGKKIGSTKYRQTGSSVKKYDRLHKAKPPGKRKSATGKTYYERRKNRSDIPGTVSGAKSFLKDQAKKELAKALLHKELSTTKRDKKYWSGIVSKRKAEVKKYS